MSHLVGIVPVAGPPLDYNFPWHDSLIPVGKDYHAVERAVHTAALAGCDTIWVVLDRVSQPIIRAKLGEWIYDPRHVWDSPTPFMKKREIPIYYISLKSKDVGKRDSNGWSILYGGKVAHKISTKISKWVAPDRYLVVSPYGIVDDEIIKENRKALRDGELIAFANNGTFKDNIPLPFVLSEQDRKRLHNNWRTSDMSRNNIVTWNQIFEQLQLDDYKIIRPNWSHDIRNWDGYTRFMASENKCIRPKYMVIHKWYGLIKTKRLIIGGE